MAGNAPRVHSRRTVVAEMALTRKSVTGSGGASGEAVNVASPAMHMIPHATP